MPETLFYTLIGVGLAFDVFGCIGLVRLPDVYNRAQAATKCVTLGTCMILIGVTGLALIGFAPPAEAGATGASGAAGDVEPATNPAMAVKAILCASFILLTSPVAAHAICRGAYLSGVRLWDGSVEDAFVRRADQIRSEQTQEGSVQG